MKPATLGMIGAALAGAVVIGLAVGSYAVPSDQPKPSSMPTAAAIAIAPRATPKPSAITLPISEPTPRAAPKRRPAPRATPERELPADPNPVTVTTTNSW